MIAIKNTLSIVKIVLIYAAPSPFSLGNTPEFWKMAKYVINQLEETFFIIKFWVQGHT